MSAIVLERAPEAPLRAKARMAGVFYLITFIAGMLALNVTNGRVTTSMISTAAYAAVTLLFYDIFKRVNKSISLIAAIVCLIGLTKSILDLFGIATIDVNTFVFFGVYCILIGYLIYRSTFMPRIVGVLMAIGGLGWLTFVSASLLKTLAPYNFAPGLIGEGVLTLWLLIKGTRS